MSIHRHLSPQTKIDGKTLEDWRLADAYRPLKTDERWRHASDDLGFRARRQAVTGDDGMSQADSA